MGKRIIVSISKVTKYMTDWMDLSSIKLVKSDTDFYYFTAKNRMGFVNQYRVARDTTTRSIDFGSRKNDTENWDWVDAMEV